MSAAERVAVPRSITRDSSHVMPGRPGGSAIEPARSAQADGDGRRGRRLLDEQRGAVVEARTDGIQRHSAGRLARLRSLRAPTASDQTSRSVRLDGASTRARGGRDLFERDRRDPRRRAGEEVDARNRLVVAELVRDVGDAVAVEHEPRAQLRFRFHQLRFGDAVALQTSASASSSAASTDGERRALVGGRRQRCRGTDPRSASGRRTPTDASPRSTSARYSRALRCGGGTRKLDHRFSPLAPVSTASRISSGKKSRSVADGA